MTKEKLVETLTKDTWFSVNFQKHTAKKYGLAILEMGLAEVAGATSYLIFANHGYKMDKKLEERKKKEKEHLVAFDDTPKFKKKMEEKIDEKYEKYEKINGIASIGAIIAGSLISGKVIGHIFTKAMNDLDKE